MDPSYSNINEVYYDGPLEDNVPNVQVKENANTNPYDASYNYNPPLVPNYYQEQPNPSLHAPYSLMTPQKSFYQNAAYPNYRITNDHRGQYVLKRQDVNTNLISSNER